MTIATYKAKFHALSRNDTPFVTIGEERILFFIKGLNSKLQILSIHMTNARMSFNEVIDFVKKVEEVRKVGQAKALTKRPKVLIPIV